MNNSVVFKMHQLEINPDTHDQYLNASRGDMITAVAIEDGTFGMYASHQPDDLTKNYIFEVFNDEAAYQEHRKSGQYQQFHQEMDGVVVSDKETDLEPQFMGHQDVALNISTPNDLWVNIDNVRHLVVSFKNNEEGTFIMRKIRSAPAMAASIKLDC